MNKIIAVLITVAMSATTNAQPVRPYADYDVIVALVKKNDGCESVTKRAGHPLTLFQCLQLSEKHRKEVLWFRPDIAKGEVVIAPMLHPGDRMFYLMDKKTGKGMWLLDPFDRLK